MHQFESAHRAMADKVMGLGVQWEDRCTMSKMQEMVAAK